MTDIAGGALRGVAAGAAGTTALNVVSRLDQMWRARPLSDAPQQVVAELVDRAGAPIPGGPAQRRHRIAALGPLSGSLNGMGLGALAGVLRVAGLRLPPAAGGPLLGLAAMAATDVPLAWSRVSRPRDRSGADWAADLVSHLAYGLVTHRTLVALQSGARASAGRFVPARPGPRAATLVHAAVLGAATGLRSTAGLTALALSSTPHDRGAAARLGSTRASAVLGVLAAAELVVDKLAGAPSRTSPQALLPRALFGAVAAAGMARRDGGAPVAAAAAVGLTAALGAAALGVRARTAAAGRPGSERVAAAAEDAVAAALSWLGARRRHLPG